ncbi:hypothetical protein PDESU_02254 [Pontiella desulfatans]|uniref:Tyr recombinase domain-containing protein n=1 Tax=Pontiella desulfatans TaxID=2750659 RepID=A0A6C2U1D1_PONDE|nr:tyrosine-type recombinase/integrase [Pontiella desulfatans]VGO13697.1 hypothetical protein PDESU_02254 [Pontiella desulfatans]
MTTGKQGSAGRAKRGMGRLYIRSRDKRDFPAGTPGVNGGVYWIEYQKPTGKTDPVTEKPIKNKKREKLLDEDGNPITTLKKARIAQEKLMAQYVTGDRVGLLKAELQRVEARHLSVIEDADPPLTVEDAWSCFKDHPALDCGSTMLYNYHGHWNQFVGWLTSYDSEVVYMRDIDRKAAFEYARLLGRKAASGTYNKHINFLKLIYYVMKEEIRGDVSPFADLTTKSLSKAKAKARAKEHTRRDLTEEELVMVLDRAEGDFQTLFMLGAYTGLRLGDCCTLKWDECLLDMPMIKRVPSKTQSEAVKIGIPPRLVRRLLETPKSKRRGYVLPECAADYNYVSEKGKNTHRTRITNRIQNHFVSCGIQIHADGTGYKVEPDPENKGKYIKVYTGEKAVVAVGFHSLRHTFISMQANKGTSQIIVQKIAGHGSSAMTGLYAHVSDDAAKRATLYIGDDVKDAEAEVITDPLPRWVRDKLEAMTEKNWKQLKEELLQR